ncbi:MAG: hypothetical protein IJR70_02540 [Eubacterium sp.]|nr:hypothetical protein [Eubacterium sp.]
MNKFEFKDAEWEVTRFLNVPISTGILSNKTEEDLGDYDEYDLGGGDGGDY